MSQQPIYLDYAAATPLDSGARAAMEPYFSNKFFNPSATYLAAQQVKNELEAARAQVAKVIGARSSEVVFTAGGTEANNLAIKGIMSQYPEAEMLVSAVEHESVLAPAHRYNCKEIPVTSEGIVDMSQFEALVADKTVLISVMYANNEVGSIQPIRRITQVASKIKDARRKTGNKLPLIVHTDACQAGNYLDLHVSRLGVDMMTLNGGKIYGPKQSGVLYVASHVRVQPMIEGGGQEQNMRSGTENIAHAVGLAKALETAQARRHEVTKTMQELQRYFIETLEAAIPSAAINGSLKSRLPNNIHITLPGQDNERLIFSLDERGILAAAGSACNASNEEPSHVLRAMGVSEGDARASLRLTMGRSTTKKDVEYTVRTLADIVKSSLY